MLGAVLSARTGLPVTVGSAAVGRAALRLRDVRVAPGPGFPADVRVRDLEVAGGVAPLPSLGGRLVARAVSTATAPAGGGASATGLDALREATRSLLAWPGTLAVRVHGGEVRMGAGSLFFDLTGTKTAAGTVTLALTLAPPGGPVAFRADAQARAADGGAVALRLDAAGRPAHLAALWPAPWPAPEAVAGRAEVTLAAGGDLDATARLSVGAPEAPVVLDLAARWTAGPGALDVSGRGEVDGSRVDADLTWTPASGTFAGRLGLAPFDARRLVARLGATLPGDVRARTLRVTARGAVGSGARVEGEAAGIEVLPALPVDATFAGDLVLGPRGVLPTRMSEVTLTLAHQGRAVAVARGGSRGAALWPVAVDARADDLGALVPLVPGAVALAGSARVTGDLAPGEATPFAGQMEVRLDRGRLELGGPITLADGRVVMPVRPGAAAPAGSLRLARLEGWGFVVEQLQSSVELDRRRLRLPDLRYAHYGGRGTGWAEAILEAGDLVARARLDGAGVDLGRLVAARGLQVARATGRVGYTASAGRSARDGLAVVVRVASEGDGGEIAIEPIRRLLESSMLEVESTGILKRTLESLQVFRYASLEGIFRLAGGEGRIDVSLRGRKRLGLFPGPVDAINFRNVPLDVLARTLARGSTP